MIAVVVLTAQFHVLERTERTGILATEVLVKEIVRFETARFFTVMTELLVKLMVRVWDAEMDGGLPPVVASIERLKEIVLELETTIRCRFSV